MSSLTHSLFKHFTRRAHSLTEIDVLTHSAQSQKELYKKHHNTGDGRIRMWLGIRQIMNATDGLLLATRDTAKELKTGIHMVLLIYLSTF